MVPVEAQACGTPVVALGTGRRVRDGPARRNRRPGRRRIGRGVRGRDRRVPATRASIATAIRGKRRALLSRALPARFPGRRLGGNGRRWELRSNQQQTDRGAPVMMRRYNRLLVAYLRHHRRAPRRGRVHAGLPAALRDADRRTHSRHQGPAAVRPVRRHAAVHRRARADRVSGPGPLSASARPLARRRLLRRVRGQHPGCRPRHHRHAGTSRPITCRMSSRTQGVYEVSQPVWALFLVDQRHLHLLVSRARARGARAAVEGRHRPEARADCRRGRPRTAGRRQGPRTSRARVQGRRLHRRSRRRRPHRLSRSAAARHADRRRRDHPRRENRPRLRRAAARGARQDARTSSRRRTAKGSTSTSFRTCCSSSPCARGSKTSTASRSSA